MIVLSNMTILLFGPCFSIAFALRMRIEPDQFFGDRCGASVASAAAMNEFAVR
jgi:hypothetical protein